MDSILQSIKILLNVSEEDDNFDQEIIMHINTALMILSQLGIGDKSGFSIIDKSKIWSDFIKDMSLYEAVKTYVHLKVKLVFDPPQTGPLVEAMERRISELEWRLEIQPGEVKRNAVND